MILHRKLRTSGLIEWVSDDDSGIIVVIKSNAKLPRQAIGAHVLSYHSPKTRDGQRRMTKVRLIFEPHHSGQGWCYYPVDMKIRELQELLKP